jgi:PPOX class probable F420-dependent enzyme
MDLDEARAFAAGNHRAVLSTFRADGRPQLSPVTCGVNDAGEVVISTRETAVKTRNLRRDPRAALCVMSDAFYGSWAQVEGDAQIDDLPDAMDGLVDYYRRISGEHPDWADYRAAMERERRVLVRISITRAGPNISG